MPEFSFDEVKIAIEKLKAYKSPSTCKILAELIQTGDKTLHFEIQKLFPSIWNMEELSESTYLQNRQ